MIARYAIRHLAVLLAVSGALASHAQSEEDALRYSYILPGGTARSWALGGAFGAVGADPASASLNPAGFGLYNASEFSLTPGFEVNDAATGFYGTSTGATRSRLSMQNMALVLNYPGESGADWRGGTFGVSFDRQASFHWQENAIGKAVNSSVLERFVNEANGTPYTELESDAFPFTSTLAWYTYALDTLQGTTDQYVAAIPFGSPVDQEHSIDGAGRLNTTSFFYGNNYKDKLYLGLSLGLVGLRYDRTTIHNESVLDQAVDLRRVQYREDLLTTGNGVDVKLGVIGRVTDHLRLGASFHSPMWLLLNDAYSYSMVTRFSTGEPYTEDSPEGSFTYRINTPWRTLVSAVYQAGKHGIVSVDYSYTDYRNTRIRASRTLVDEYDFALENDVIKDRFASTHSVRVGTEWRSGSWYFRGGAGFFPNAYVDKDPRQGTAYKVYTGGLGFRITHMSVDLALLYGQRDTVWYPYSPDLVKPATGQLTDVRTMLTVAFRP